MKMIPKFKKCKRRRRLSFSNARIIVKIYDTHRFFNKLKKQQTTFLDLNGFPADFKIIDKKVVLTNFYNDSLAKLMI
jgi:hypothetical protein